MGVKRESEARDPEVFERFFRENYSRVFAYAARRTGADAEEVVSETFVVAWVRYGDSARGGLPWLYRTAQHILQNQRRSQIRRERVTSKLAAQPKTNKIDLAESQANQDWVRHALHTLSEADQQILMLLHWEDLDSKSAAQVLGCTTATAAVRAHRARSRLQAALVSIVPNTVHSTAPHTTQVTP